MMKFFNFKTIFIYPLIFCWIGLSCSKKNPTSVQVLPENSIVHSVDIGESEIWDASFVHVISSKVSVNNSILKIMPGTKVHFEKDASLNIMGKSGLIADGSSEEIIFSSSIKEKGFWKYIYFADNVNDDSCRLINCKIEYGGGDEKLRGAIYCDNASPQISNCEITNVPCFGIELVGDCRQIEINNNTISHSDFVPLQTYACNLSSIGVNNYLENGSNYIRITDGQITEDDIWYKRSVPFRLADGLHIKRAKLTIEPGIILLFEKDEFTSVAENGCIVADGSSEPIIFTGFVVGSWKGIFFNSTSDAANSRLKNCVIENAGGDEYQKANIILEDSAPEICDCLIHKSLGHGIYISGDFSPELFINNVVTSNSLMPISSSANAVSNIPEGMYRGNGVDAILVRGGDLDGMVSNNGYWNNLEIPYQINGIVKIVASTLIIAPGVTIQMTEGSGFEVLNQGGLIADGSSSMINFTGIRQVMGCWKYIYFSSFANEMNCQMIHCQINYGGSDPRHQGMIFCDRITPIIKNCFIEFSESWGIYVVGENNIVDILSNNYRSNGLGNYFP